MKRLVVFLFVVLLAFNGVFGMASISDLAVTDPGDDNVTVSATVSWGFMGMTELQVETTDGLLRRYFMPEQQALRVNIIQWSNAEWNPYFQGDYEVKVTQYDISQSVDVESATTNHTVVRDPGGSVLGIEYFTDEEYDINSDAWSPVNLSNVKLHSTGLMGDEADIMSVGCNLLNATVDVIDAGQSGEDMSLLFDDTSEFYPAGTYFSFTTRLHQRPAGIMGMGNLVKYQWIPDDPSDKAGTGILNVHVSSCSPWRSSAERPIGSHVGFAPLFIGEDDGNSLRSDDSDELSGVLMCTSAHYLDVQPVEPESDDSTGDDRVGLKVDGHAGTNSFLKVFVPDNVLQETWGVTNAATELTGYVDGLSLDSGLVSLVRVEGGSTNIVYDWDGDGTNDAGYIAHFNFDFPDEQSLRNREVEDNSVVAELGKAVEIGPVSPVYRFYSYGAPESTYTHLWTISEAEKDVVSTYPSWQYEGVAWLAHITSESGSTPLYRLYEPNIKRHVYTINATEYVALENTSWNGEGVQYFVYPTNLVAGVIPAYRFYHAENQNHHFTIDENEKDTIIERTDWGYTYEGIAFYVFPTNVNFGARMQVTRYEDMKLPANPVVEDNVWRLEGDYDGSGVIDTAFYDETSGAWSIYRADGSAIVEGVIWGGAGLLPSVADYDNDGVDDLCVYFEETGEWFILSVSGEVLFP